MWYHDVNVLPHIYISHRNEVCYIILLNNHYFIDIVLKPVYMHTKRLRVITEPILLPSVQWDFTIALNTCIVLSINMK